MAGGNDSHEEGGGSGNDSPRKVGADDEGQPKKKKVKLNLSGLSTILTDLNGNVKMQANDMLNFREERKIEMAAKAAESELSRKATAAMLDEIRSGVAKLQKEQRGFKREFGKNSTEGDEGDVTSGSKEKRSRCGQFCGSPEEERFGRCKFFVKFRGTRATGVFETFGQCAYQSAEWIARVSQFPDS